MSIRKKGIRVLLLALTVAALCMVPAFASSAGNVADAVEQTWTDAAGQIKTVVDTVVFPALTMVLGIAFFVKVALCFFDYRKHGQFEWTGAAILFVCLIFVLLAQMCIRDSLQGALPRGLRSGPERQCPALPLSRCVPVCRILRALPGG